MGNKSSYAIPIVGKLANNVANIFRKAGVTGSLSTHNQMALQDHSYEQSKELAEMQNEWEKDRMALQYSYNKDAAGYTQQLAKDMWEYTGIGGQVRQ